MAGAALAVTAAVAIGAALTKGIADSINVEAGTDKVQAQLGLTEAQAGVAGKAAGSLYAANYGASMEEVNGAVASVMSSIKGMRNASDADVESMTAKMLNLSAVMEIDVARAAQVTGQMITSGLAKDGVHAADLLTASLQKVPAAVREDILDAVDEYAPFMSSLGIKGEDAMGILVRASEKGMYGIDKTGDALKEFGIRATDMSVASKAGYDAMGMSQEEMSGKLLAGGETAKTAFNDIVQGLSNMKDPVAQSQAALALFGTPLEDLSVTEIPNFLNAIDPMGDKFDSVAGAADKMGADLTSNAKAGFDGFVRQADAALIGFVQDKIMPSVSQFASFLNTDVGPAITRIGDWIDNTALPALRGFGDWFTTNLPAIQNWATGIGFILIPLFLRIAISAGVSAAAQVVAWVTAGAGAITTAAVYVAQSYIMIGRWVAMGAAAVVNAAIVVGGWVSMAVGATVNAVVMAAGWLVGVVVPAAAALITFLVSVAGVVGGWIAMAAGAMLNAAVMAAAWFIALGPIGWIIATVIGLVAVIIMNWEAVSKFTTEAFTNIWNFLTDVWNNIVNGIVGFISWYVKTISTGFTAVWNFISDVLGNIGNFFADTWNNVTRGISEFIGGLIGFFRDLPGNILGSLGNIGDLLLNAGGQIIEGFLKGLQDGFESVKNFVGGIGDWIAKNKGPKAYDLALLIPAGGWIMDGLGKGIERSMPGLKKILGGVSATIATGVTGGTVGLTGIPGGSMSGTPQSGSKVITNNWNISEQSDPQATAMNVARRQQALGV